MGSNPADISATEEEGRSLYRALPSFSIAWYEGAKEKLGVIRMADGAVKEAINGLVQSVPGTVKDRLMEVAKTAEARLGKYVEPKENIVNVEGIEVGMENTEGNGDIEKELFLNNLDEVVKFACEKKEISEKVDTKYVTCTEEHFENNHKIECTEDEESVNDWDNVDIRSGTSLVETSDYNSYEAENTNLQTDDMKLFKTWANQEVFLSPNAKLDLKERSAIPQITPMMSSSSMFQSLTSIPLKWYEDAKDRFGLIRSTEDAVIGVAAGVTRNVPENLRRKAREVMTAMDSAIGCFVTEPLENVVESINSGIEQVKESVTKGAAAESGKYEDYSHTMDLTCTNCGHKMIK